MVGVVNDFPMLRGNPLISALSAVFPESERYILTCGSRLNSRNSRNAIGSRNGFGSCAIMLQYTSRRDLGPRFAKLPSGRPRSHADRCSRIANRSSAFESGGSRQSIWPTIRARSETNIGIESAAGVQLTFHRDIPLRILCDQSLLEVEE